MVPSIERAQNLDKKILVAVLSHNDKAGKATSLGSFETSVNKLIAAKMGGFGSGDNLDDSKTIPLMEDGKEMGRIAVLSAHADTPRERPVVLPAASKSTESRSMDSRSRSSYSSYGDSYSRRSRSSRSWSSRGSRSRSLSRSRRSYGSRSSYSSYSRRSSRSSRSSSRKRRSSVSKSDVSGESSSESESSVSEVEEEDPNALHEDATLHLSLCGVDLMNVEGFFGTSDPFIQIAAYMGVPGALMWQAIFRSEHIDDTLQPRWKPLELNLDVLCKRDLDQPIQISVFDYEENGKHQPMGSLETTVNGLIEAKVLFDDKDGKVNTSKAFTVMHNGEVYGQLVVSEARIENPVKPKIEPVVNPNARVSNAGTAAGGKKKKKGKKQKRQHQVKFNTEQLNPTRVSGWTNRRTFLVTKTRKMRKADPGKKLYLRGVATALGILH